MKTYTVSVNPDGSGVFMDGGKWNILPFAVTLTDHMNTCRSDQRSGLTDAMAVPNGLPARFLFLSACGCAIWGGDVAESGLECPKLTDASGQEFAYEH